MEQEWAPEEAIESSRSPDRSPAEHARAGHRHVSHVNLGLLLDDQRFRSLFQMDSSVRGSIVTTMGRCPDSECARRYRKMIGRNRPISMLEYLSGELDRE